MQSVNRIETFRFETIRQHWLHDEVQSINPKPAVDTWHVLILQEATKLFQYAIRIVYELDEELKLDIQRWKDSAGRARDLTMPYEISITTHNIASKTTEVSNQVDQYISTLEVMDEEASFNADCPYKYSAAKAMNSSRTVAETLPFAARTYLWLSWIQEGIQQLSKTAYKIRKGEFQDLGESAFAFIAHPSIIVIALSCTASIEEAGAKFINRHTEQHQDEDETSSSVVLRKLRDYGFDEVEFDKIENRVCKSRDDLVHYITKREQAVSLDELTRFVDAATEARQLIRMIVQRLVGDHVEQFFMKTGFNKNEFPVT